MRINLLYFFKTPLDVNYKNVYDEYEQYSDYFRFLFQNFPYFAVSTPDFYRSVKQTDNGMNLVITKGQMEVREYNYCVVVDNTNKLYFYFVVKTESLNDGVNSESTRVFLEYDSWTNNYLNGLKDCYVDTTIKHCDNLKCEVSEENPNKFLLHTRHYKAYKGDEQKNIDNSSKSLAANYSLDANYFVLWYEIRLDPESFDINTIYRNGSVVAQGALPIFYYPCCILKKSNRNFLDTIYFKLNGIRYPITGEEAPYSTVETLIDGIVGFNNVLNIQGVNIMDVRLTFFAPIQYTLQIIDGEYHFVLNPDTANFVEIKGTLVENAIEKTLIVSKDSGYSKTYISIDDIDGSIEPNDINALNTARGYENVWFLDGAFMDYPIKYQKVIYSNVNNVLEYNYDTDKKYFIIDMKNVSSPSIAIVNASTDKEISTYINNKKREKIPQSGIALFSNDSLQAYWRNNATQVSAAKLGATYNFISSTLAAGLVGVTNTNMAAYSIGEIVKNSTKFFSDMIAISAVKTDADRAIDEFSVTTENALDDLVYCDDVIVYTRECVDKHFRKEYFNLIHRYGYESNERVKISDNVRTSFDFISGNSDLIFINNNVDKIKLMTALDNGITKWHLNAPLLSAIKEMDWEINNIETNAYNYIKENLQ